MRAKLKELYSLDFDLTSYRPDRPDKFGIWVRAMAGPEGEEGSESFDIQVCTPDWLKSEISGSEPIFGRHTLIVSEFDLKKIKQVIATYCDGCSAESWEEVARKVARIGQWEFEDYQPA